MKTKKSLWWAAVLLLLGGCSKQSDNTEIAPEAVEEVPNAVIAAATTYTLYTIKAGQHYCDKSTFKSLSLSEQKFTTRFDSSAIYKTIDPVNQYDINKLYGFSEGINHEYNSARIGWAWNNGYLRLYAYAYKNGVRQSKEITRVAIGSEIACSIKVSGYSYIFTVNGVSVSLARAKNTATASGYQLYPYFGGDEVAPQDIRIAIKNS